MTLRNVGGVWYQTEIIARPTATYGRYGFFVDSRLDLLYPSTVFAMFLYADDDHELDIEMTKAFETGYNGWHVVQDVAPGTSPAWTNKFSFTMTGSYSTHIIDWQSLGTTFTSAHGHYTYPPSTAIISGASYFGTSNPADTDGLHLRIQLRLFGTTGPSWDEEVIVTGCTF
jgi:hypothetical protein